MFYNYFTVVVLTLNLLISAPLFIKYYLYLLIFYGTRLIQDTLFMNDLDEKYVGNKYLMYCIFIFMHYILPVYLIYRYKIFLNGDLNNTNFLLGIFFALLYVNVVDVESLYFIERDTIIYELYIIWCVMFIISCCYMK